MTEYLKIPIIPAYEIKICRENYNRSGHTTPTVEKHWFNKSEYIIQRNDGPCLISKSNSGNEYLYGISNEDTWQHEVEQWCLNHDIDPLDMSDEEVLIVAMEFV